MFRQKITKIMHYLFFWCHEEECQKITNINSYQQRALLWTKYERSYSKVFKAVDWGKRGSFMRTSHVRIYFAKTLTWIHNQRNQKNQKFKILPRHVHTMSITMMINMINIINLAEVHCKTSLTNHFRRNRNALFALQWRAMVTDK